MKYKLMYKFGDPGFLEMRNHNYHARQAIKHAMMTGYVPTPDQVTDAAAASRRGNSQVNLGASGGVPSSIVPVPYGGETEIRMSTEFTDIDVESPARMVTTAKPVTPKMGLALPPRIRRRIKRTNRQYLEGVVGDYLNAAAGVFVSPPRRQGRDKRQYLVDKDL